jgi:hypothetical protein
MFRPRIDVNVKVGLIVVFVNFANTESASYLMFKFCFTVKVWEKIKNWLGFHALQPASWTVNISTSVKGWWRGNLNMPRIERIAMSSLVMLASWEV